MLYKKRSDHVCPESSGAFENFITIDNLGLEDV